MSPLQFTAESHPIWQFWEKNESTADVPPPEISDTNTITEDNSNQTQVNNTKKPISPEITAWLQQEVPKTPWHARWSIIAELIQEKFGQSYSPEQLRRYQERLRDNRPRRRQIQKAKAPLPAAPALEENDVKEILNIIFLKEKINTLEIGQTLNLSPNKIYLNIISGDLGNNSEYRKSIILKYSQLFPNPQEVIEKIDTLFKSYIQATAHRLRRDKSESLSALPDLLIAKAQPREIIPMSVRQFALRKAEKLRAGGKRIKWKEVAQDVEKNFQITIAPEKLRKSCNSLKSTQEANKLSTIGASNQIPQPIEELELNYANEDYGLINKAQIDNPEPDLADPLT